MLSYPMRTAMMALLSLLNLLVLITIMSSPMVLVKLLSRLDLRLLEELEGCSLSSNSSGSTATNFSPTTLYWPSSRRTAVTGDVELQMPIDFNRTLKANL